MKFIDSHSKILIGILLAVDAFFFYQIIIGDLNSSFESVGSIVLMFFWAIQVVVTLGLWILSLRLYLKSQKARGESIRNMFLLLLLLVFTLGIVFLPGPLVRHLAPNYDYELKLKSEKTLTELISLYKEPAFLPEKMNIIEKKVESVTWNGGTATLYTSYDYECEPASDLKRVRGFLRISHSPFRDVNYENGEKIIISGKEAIIFSNISITIPGEEVIIRIENIRCSDITSEDLIKIAESLEPTEYSSDSHIDRSYTYRRFE